MKTISHTRSYSDFIETTSNVRRKKLHERIKASILLETVLGIKLQCNLEEIRNPVIIGWFFIKIRLTSITSWIFPAIKSKSQFMPLIVAPNQRPDNTLTYFEEDQCTKPCQNSCQNCGWMIRPEVILEIRKKPNFWKWLTSLLFTSFYYL